MTQQKNTLGILAMARANADAAFDQAGEYSTLAEAIDSYRQNVTDTLNDDGIKDATSHDMALAAFDGAVNEARTRQADTHNADLERQLMHARALLAAEQEASKLYRRMYELADEMLKLQAAMRAPYDHNRKG